MEAAKVQRPSARARSSSRLPPSHPPINVWETLRISMARNTRKRVESMQFPIRWNGNKMLSAERRLGREKTKRVHSEMHPPCLGVMICDIFDPSGPVSLPSPTCLTNLPHVRHLGTGNPFHRCSPPLHLRCKNPLFVFMRCMVAMSP